MSNAKVIDGYALLGVPRDATADQIESKWREIQARYHPDQYEGVPEVVAMLANHKLQQIDAAAGVLLDTARRAELDESLRKSERRGAPARPALVSESLDFGHIGPGKSQSVASGSGSASAAAPRKTTPGTDRDKAGGPRRAAVFILAMIAIALMIVFATTRRSSKEPVAPSPSATPASPTHRSPPAHKPPQTYTPAPKVQTPPPQAAKPPPQATTPQSVPARAIPVEFMQVFQKYATQSGSKALALALDSNGRWAYGSISGYSAQPAANEEALSECMRFKAQNGIQEDCRLFAIGEKVVW